jgi:hypothetical protein
MLPILLILVQILVIPLDLLWAAVPIATAAPLQERRHTRLQSGISRPKEFTDGTIRYDRIRFGNFCSTGEPTSSSEAFSDSR